MASQSPEVDVDELARAQAGGATIIDVRQPDEYDAGHVPGARLIPLDEVARRVNEVPRDEPVYVVCLSGGRSEKAARFYRAQGIDAYSVTGGTKEWVSRGQPTVSGPHPG